MMGQSLQRESKLFYLGFNLEDRVPADHPLRPIDRLVDFSFVRPKVAALYGYNGNVSVDPTLVLKLMFLCFFENIRSERELLRQLPVRLDWLWFCGLDLDSVIPDHSVLSKARRRWGERTFEQVFTHVLDRCEQAGLLQGRTVHADSTLLKANAALEGRVSRKLWEQLEEAMEPNLRPEDQDEPPDDPPAAAGNQGKSKAPGHPESMPGGTKLNQRLVSPVDPDAATSTRKAGGTTLGYRDHRLVDDRHGVILATVATAADIDDGSMLGELLGRQEQYIGRMPHEVVGDSMYGTRENYRNLARANIKAYLKKRRGKDSPKISWVKLLAIGCTAARARELLGRRKSRAEGSFADAHVRMNHRRCRWRGRWRVQIQCYLVASVQNLKKLIRHPGRDRSVASRVLLASTRRTFEIWMNRVIGNELLRTELI